jgi:hypothetical protein
MKFNSFCYFDEVNIFPRIQESLSFDITPVPPPCALVFASRRKTAQQSRNKAQLQYWIATLAAKGRSSR